ncbi:glycosyltransferase family 2 protein [Candidatus Sumerlaeota bacterium]|nr:glycosyltransferase family 2 protein [Candidatus Sumerlaeota bacterium]
MTAKVFVVFPAYNEETGLPAAMNEIKELLTKMEREFLFIVVNDGSKDRTQEVAEEAARTMPVEIIRHDVNKNVGAVFRNGLTRAAQLARPEDIILTTEADNTCAPEIFEEMIQAIEQGKDVAVATRYEKGGQIVGFPFMRRIYSYWINLMLRVMYPVQGCSDYSIFMRAYRAEVIQQSIEFYGEDWIESVGFVANAEILIKARIFKLKGYSAGMLYRYSAKAGASKLNVKKTIMEYFQFFARLRRCAKRHAAKTPPSLVRNA